MATVSRVSATKTKIPVRQITNDDLRWSLRQGLADFGDLRGDLVFAGLIYTFIGLAAVVMTTNGPLMPFFLPVVAGVAGFLRLRDAVRNDEQRRDARHDKRPPPREFLTICLRYARPSRLQDRETYGLHSGNTTTKNRCPA